MEKARRNCTRISLKGLKLDCQFHPALPVVQFSSVAQSCLTLCNPMDCSTPGLPVHQQLPELLKLMCTESVMPSNDLILCCPLLLLPSIFPSIRVFSSESVLRIRGPKHWSFSFSISSSNEYSGSIQSFRRDWLDLLAVQGTLKSLLQHHSSKASIHHCSAFFTVQLSHPYMSTGKTIALTRWTLSAKQCVCFLICCLGWSLLFFQGASVFEYHGCTHHLQWFWSPRI